MIIIGPFVENTLSSDCCPGSKTSWTVTAPGAKGESVWTEKVLAGSLCALGRKEVP